MPIDRGVIGAFREALHPLDDADGLRALDIYSPAGSSRSFCMPERVRALLPTLTPEAPPPSVVRAKITVGDYPTAAVRS